MSESPFFRNFRLVGCILAAFLERDPGTGFCCGLCKIFQSSFFIGATFGSLNFLLGSYKFVKHKFSTSKPQFRKIYVKFVESS